jgi:hypothetical protein
MYLELFEQFIQHRAKGWRTQATTRPTGIDHCVELSATAPMMSFWLEELTVATGRSKTCIGFHKIYLNLFAAIHLNFDRDLDSDLLIGSD